MSVSGTLCLEASAFVWTHWTWIVYSIKILSSISLNFIAWIIFVEICKHHALPSLLLVGLFLNPIFILKNLLPISNHAGLSIKKLIYSTRNTLKLTYLTLSYNCLFLHIFLCCSSEMVCTIFGLVIHNTRPKVLPTNIYWNGTWLNHPFEF